jgi:hypothetical protein
VDLAGAKEMVRTLERAKLEVPKVLQNARSRPLFREAHVDIGRFFVG